MASTDTFLQRHSGSVELLSFVPKKEQKDFSQYLYSNYQVWNKERRRCFYRCRKFKKNSIPIINIAPSFTLNSVLSISILPSPVPFCGTTTERIKTKPNLELNSKSNSKIKSKMMTSAFSSGSASSFHTSCTLPAPLFDPSSITSACTRITSNKTFTSHMNSINVKVCFAPARVSSLAVATKPSPSSRHLKSSTSGRSVGIVPLKDLPELDFYRVPW